jgi:hypothetical protein
MLQEDWRHILFTESTETIDHKSSLYDFSLCSSFLLPLKEELGLYVALTLLSTKLLYSFLGSSLKQE